MIAQVYIIFPTSIWKTILKYNKISGNVMWELINHKCVETCAKYDKDMLKAILQCSPEVREDDRWLVILTCVKDMETHLGDQGGQHSIGHIPKVRISLVWRNTIQFVYCVHYCTQWYTNIV